MRKILTIVGLAAVLAPAAVRAQTPDEQIRRSLERAEQAGVPVALLQSKVDEGRAKGIPAARIAAAVAHRLEVLEHVHDRLEDRNLDAAELGVAADAAQAGVSDEVLASLTEKAPRGRRAVALATLTQLVQQGHAPEEALQRVTEALERGPDALLNLPAQAAGRGNGNGVGNAGNAGATGGGVGAGGPKGPTGAAAGQGGGRGGPPAGVPAGPKGPTGPKGGTGMMGPTKKPGGDY